MRFSAWVVMLTIMITFLTFMGVETGLSSILTTIGIDITGGEFQSADMVGSSLWTTIIAVLAIVSGGTLIIGLFARGYDPSLVIVPLITFTLTLYVPAFISIMNYMAGFNQSWLTALIVTIFGGLMVGFTMESINYFAGR